MQYKGKSKIYGKIQVLKTASQFCEQASFDASRCKSYGFFLNWMMFINRREYQTNKLMTEAQIWWMILRVYKENNRVVITHELSIPMQETHNTREMIAKVIPRVIPLLSIKIVEKQIYLRR